MISPRPLPSAAVDTTFASQCLGEFLARLRKIDPHPAVLDLGILCGANIAFLGSQGCRVSVESLPRPASGATAVASAVGPKADRGLVEGAVVAGPPTPLPPLSYPAESFAGILAWDAIARIPQKEAVALVENMRRLLLNGGVVLAHFPGPPGNMNGAAGRYRILNAERLAVEPSPHKNLPAVPYQNREIYALFARFDVVRLSHMKSGTREVLVARSRRH